MKTRNGFVSNSSTSSFLIYGIVISDDGAELGLTEEEKADLSECFYTKIKQDKLDLETHTPEYCGTYVGRSWAGIRDDQTGAQFKEEVRNELIKLLGKHDIKCETHEHAWRNG